jgi:PBP1b-binding outer membrane lipoprotein LpoB
MKQILIIILILGVILSGCVQPEEPSSQETIDEIQQETDEFAQLEQELDNSDLDDFEAGLEDLEDW